jgi:membrane-associated PAP2 superfamily phosphatase
VLSIAAVTLILSVVFRLLPGLDLWVSRGFYDPTIGFPAAHIPVAIWLREASASLTRIIVAVLILVVLVKLVLPKRPSLVRPASTVFLLTSLALGPGLLVNGILKAISGRPRPLEVLAFGGDQPFSAAWQFGGSCTANCSFVSGEAAVAIWLLAFALIVPARWRRAVSIATIAWAALLSLNRIAFGAHFLSDVVLAWALTLLIVALAHHILFVKPPFFLDNDIIEAALTRVGLDIRRLVERVAKLMGPAPIPPDRNRAKRGMVGRDGDQADNGREGGDKGGGHGEPPDPGRT